MITLFAILHIHILIKKQHFGIKIFKTLKGKEIQNKVNLHFTHLYTHKIRKINIHNDEGIYFPHIETCMPLRKNNIESSIQSQVKQMNIVKKK